MTADIQKLLRDVNQIEVGLTASQGQMDGIQTALGRLCAALSCDAAGFWQLDVAAGCYRLRVASSGAEALPDCVPPDARIIDLTVHSLEAQVMSDARWNAAGGSAQSADGEGPA